MFCNILHLNGLTTTSEDNKNVLCWDYYAPLCRVKARSYPFEHQHRVYL